MVVSLVPGTTLQELVVLVLVRLLLVGREALSVSNVARQVTLQ